jgi:hypothetical protein
MYRKFEKITPSPRNYIHFTSPKNLCLCPIFMLIKSLRRRFKFGFARQALWVGSTTALIMVVPFMVSQELLSAEKMQVLTIRIFYFILDYGLIYTSLKKWYFTKKFTRFHIND